MSINIKPENKGRFSLWAKKHGKSVQGAANMVMSNKKDYSSHVIEMANFSKNASHFSHALGGMVTSNGNQGVTTKPGKLNVNTPYSMRNSKLKRGNQQYAMGGNVPVEVEGDEAMQTPDGQVGQFQGASHEDGGIQANLPEGTNIYSDRLSLDGKTMAERKLARERNQARLEKLLKKNPTDSLTKNSLKKVQTNNAEEEAIDMQLQMAAQQAHQPKMAYGGKVRRYEDGGEIPYLNFNYNTDMQPLDIQNSGQLPVNYNNPASFPNQNSPSGVSSWAPALGSALGSLSSTPNTYGNLLGMTGTAISAIGPLMTTIANKRATPPNINRYIGYGQNALNDNQSAIDTENRQRNTQLDNATSQRNGQIAYNNNSSQNINTQRALNSATDLGYQRNANDLSAIYSDKIANLYGQRAGLNNQRDAAVDRGQTNTDQQNKMDIDNYYTNLNKDIGNIGTGLQSFGKNLNTQKSNDDFLNTLPYLSNYGVGVTYDANGNPIYKKVR